MRGALMEIAVTATASEEWLALKSVTPKERGL